MHWYAGKEIGGQRNQPAASCCRIHKPRGKYQRADNQQRFQIFTHSDSFRLYRFILSAYFIVRQPPLKESAALCYSVPPTV